VLRGTSQVFRASLRHIDVLARLGGEEFVVLLPGTDTGGASVIAEKLLETVAKNIVYSDRGKISITSSFGVAEVCPDDKSIDCALERADAALYEAKRCGRNCVRAYRRTSVMVSDVTASTATGGTSKNEK
jgi:two-component system, cell cycle response regulator